MEARSTPSRMSCSASRFLSFTHVAAHTNSLLIFLAQYCSFAWVSQTQAPLAVEGHLGSFHFGAVTSQVATSNCRQAFLGTCVFLSLGEHQSGNTGSYAYGKLVSTETVPLVFPPAAHKSSFRFTSSPTCDIIHPSCLSF